MIVLELWLRARWILFQEVLASRRGLPGRSALRAVTVVVAATLGAIVSLSISQPASPDVLVAGAWRPPPGGYLTLRPVGSFASLPDDKHAAALVRRSSWEIRPDNTAANLREPVRLHLRLTDVRSKAYDPRWNTYVLARVSGHFTGTTDEIIQWVAVKWGLPDEVLRAIAVMESDWHQSRQGDYSDDPQRCLPGYAPPCPMGFGIVGVRSNSWPGSFPAIRDSTAASLDILGGWLRGCQEGWIWWLRDHGSRQRGAYQAGDLWGCVGAWFSGNWRDGSLRRTDGGAVAVGSGGGEDYLQRAQRWYATKPWLSSGY